MPADSFRESSCVVGEDPYEHMINPAHAYNSEYNSAKSPLIKQKPKRNFVFEEKFEELKEPQSHLISKSPRIKDSGADLKPV